MPLIIGTDLSDKFTKKKILKLLNKRDFLLVDKGFSKDFLKKNKKAFKFFSETMPEAVSNKKEINLEYLSNLVSSHHSKFLRKFFPLIIRKNIERIRKPFVFVDIHILRMLDCLEIADIFIIRNNLKMKNLETLFKKPGLRVLKNTKNEPDENLIKKLIYLLEKIS